MMFLHPDLDAANNTDGKISFDIKEVMFSLHIYQIFTIFRLVHYPKDNKYTIRPLEVTHLAGRDPETGRVVAKGIGGGVKHKFHWIQFDREAPEEGTIEERVIDIIFDGHRSAKIAIVGCGDKLKYIIATENMKPGDLIKTSRVIPRNPGKFQNEFLLSLFIY